MNNKINPHLIVIPAAIIVTMLLAYMPGCNSNKPYQYEKDVIVWDIQSLRVDDDSEYHITAVSPSGKIQSWEDWNWDIEIRQSSVLKPVIHQPIAWTDSLHSRYILDNERPAVVYIPVGYKIETFDD